jgi:hypothetical protein
MEDGGDWTNFLRAEIMFSSHKYTLYLDRNTDARFVTLHSWNLSGIQCHETLNIPDCNFDIKTPEIYTKKYRTRKYDLICFSCTVSVPAV